MHSGQVIMHRVARDNVRQAFVAYVPCARAPFFLATSRTATGDHYKCCSKMKVSGGRPTGVCLFQCLGQLVVKMLNIPEQVLKQQ